MSRDLGGGVNGAEITEATMYNGLTIGNKNSRRFSGSFITNNRGTICRKRTVNNIPTPSAIRMRLVRDSVNRVAIRVTMTANAMRRIWIAEESANRKRGR